MALTDVSVLLVEDDPVFSQLMRDFLDTQGARVEFAIDGLQGLKLFNEHVFDVVIADLNMPKMGGLPMLRQMMTINPQLPAIVISANDVMSDVIEALRIGASDYLIKPVTDLFVVEAAIQQALASAKSEFAAKANDGSDDFSQQFADLSYYELNQNLLLLEQNSQAAKNVQQQLFPASHIQYPNAAINYSLFKNNDVSAYFIDSTMVDDDHLVMYMAHFLPEDNRSAFGCVLLSSFVNDKLKRFRIGQSSILLNPAEMLTYLNDKMMNSGLHLFANMVYVCIDLRSFDTTIAQAGEGLRCYLRNVSGLAPLALPKCQPIGSVLCKVQMTHERRLMPGESICIGTCEQQHQQLLLDDQFKGLVFDKTIVAGGFMQLDVS
ncbi:response regulator [Shewanella aestuarii]|uniref:Response regulator n=1 Tax=Shewanella aestuarii TaxID=1028752 RepID=A0A6G9QHS2_9GAMM|nr:response regulator [Shewanella aestuarii]QIR14012.1 response regulator [Shewanella aestuarii]